MLSFVLKYKLKQLTETITNYLMRLQKYIHLNIFKIQRSSTFHNFMKYSLKKNALQTIFNVVYNEQAQLRKYQIFLNFRGKW